MIRQCRFCAGLSVESLVLLAEKDLQSHEFSRRAFYQHQPSIADLVQSAHNECDLCQVIVESLETTLATFSPAGAENDDEISLFTAAESIEITDIKLCINTRHVYPGESLDKVEMFDTVMIQVGPISEEYNTGMFDKEDVSYEDYFVAVTPALSTIRAPRSKYRRTAGG